jgi:hypothetical protein
VLPLRSAEELGEYPVAVVHSLRAWATIAPNYPLVAERDRGGWRTVTYGRTVAAADSIGQAGQGKQPRRIGFGGCRWLSGGGTPRRPASLTAILPGLRMPVRAYAGRHITCE